MCSWCGQEQEQQEQEQQKQQQHTKKLDQNWGEMFECLLQYKEEQRKKQTIGLSDKEREEWKWDGNVPTMYKVRCDIPRTPCKCYMVNFKFILFIL